VQQVLSILQSDLKNPSAERSIDHMKADIVAHMLIPHYQVTIPLFDPTLTLTSASDPLSLEPLGPTSRPNPHSPDQGAIKAAHGIDTGTAGAKVKTDSNPDPNHACKP